MLHYGSRMSCRSGATHKGVSRGMFRTRGARWTIVSAVVLVMVLAGYGNLAVSASHARPGASQGVAPSMIDCGSSCGSGCNPCTVTFSETGLPTGTSWSVTLAGTTQSSTSTSISFSEPTGTYSYSVGVVAGYGSTPSSGSITVNGAAVGVGVQFVSIYTVTFTESGLPAGTSWTVYLGSNSQTSTSATITFNEPSGSYSFHFQVPGYTPNPCTGTITVNGASVSQTVSFTVTTYTVTFDESGLSGTYDWFVTLGGTERCGSTSTILFLVPNGTYSWTAGMCTPHTYYTATGEGYGTVTVSGSSPNPVTIAFEPKFQTVKFKESGLSDPTWSVTMSNATWTKTVSVTGTGLQFTGLFNGTYTFSVQPSKVAYATPARGTVTIAGTTISCFRYDGTQISQGTCSIGLAPLRHTIAFGAIGLTSGTWSVVLSNSSWSSTHSSKSTSLQFTDLYNGSYSFQVIPPSGWQVSPSAGVVTVSGSDPPTVTLTFSLRYLDITFKPTGLPCAGSSGWTLTVYLPNGSAETFPGSGGPVSVLLESGDYSALVGPPPRCYAIPTHIEFTVVESNFTIPVAFGAYENPASFVASGLGGSSSWCVALNVTNTTGSGPNATATFWTKTLCSTASTITFSYLSNGSYLFHVAPPPNFYAQPGHGSITIAGAPVTTSVNFGSTLYAVEFVETGLPSGSSWSVTLCGSSLPSTSSTVTFSEPNGTCSFSVTGPSQYVPTPASGTVTIAGAGLALSVVFAPPQYAASFTETGLPSGDSWSVTLSGVLQSSEAATITFSGLLATLSYPYVIGLPAGVASNPSQGTVATPSGDVTIDVTIGPPRAVMFSGPDASWTWSVTVGGQTETSTGGTIAFAQPDGTFTYLAGPATSTTGGVTCVAEPTNGNGMFTVAGGDVFISVQYDTSAPSCSAAVTFTGPSSGWSWSVTLNGVTQTSTVSTIVFYENPGTYSFSASNAYYGTCRMTPSPSSGTVVVAGQPVSVSITYGQLYCSKILSPTDAVGTPQGLLGDGGTTLLAGVRT